MTGIDRYKNTHLEQFDINEKVLIFHPKLKNFDPPPTDNLGPRAYDLEFYKGGRRKVNQQWLVKYPSHNPAQDNES